MGARLRVFWEPYGCYYAGVVRGKGLHSSTSQHNLSRFWSLMPQLPSTSQLNLRRFALMRQLNSPTISAHVKPNSGSVYYTKMA